MFLKKSSQQELMDDLSIGDSRIKGALEELRTINRLLGGNAVTEKGVRNLCNGRVSPVKILDVGGGGSDIFSDLVKKYHLEVYSLDINKHSCHYQKENHPDNQVICADAAKMPVKEKSFDIVHSSLFLHHFSENQIIGMLRYFLLTSGRGVIINDLRRNIIAYAGIRLLTIIFSRSTFVRNDAPLSVRRAFTRKEIVSLLLKAGIINYSISRMWAFRFLIVIPSKQK